MKDNKEFLEKIQTLIKNQKELNAIIKERGLLGDDSNELIKNLEKMEEEYLAINMEISNRIEEKEVLGEFRENSTSIKSSKGISIRNPINSFKSRQQLKSFEKKFKELFKLLHLNFTDEVCPDTNFDFEKIFEKVEKELNKLKFFKEGDVYTNAFLKNIDDESKLKTIYTILWPAIHKKIKEAHQAILMMQDISRNHKSLHLIFDFSERNNFDPDDVINIIMQDKTACDNIFANQKGVSKIKDNYDEIFNSVNLFSINTTKITNYLTVLLSVSEDIKSNIQALNLKDEDKEALILSIDESTLGFIDGKGKPMKYKALKANMDKLNDRALTEKQKIKP